MHDPDVTTFSPRHDQYDFWFDAAAHKGEDALVVTDEHLGTGGFDKLFDKITKLETVPIVRYGTTIYRPSIYLAQGFHGTTGK
jgi:hypothetical protein